MPRRLVAVALLCLSLALAGCADRRVGRDDLAFPVASSLEGVNASAPGDLDLVAGSGILVEPSNASVLIRLADVAQSTVFQACAGPCVPLTVPRGALVADAGVVSLRNVSLNAVGPDGDSSVFFFDGGRETGQFLRWSDAVGSFQISSGLQVGGNVTALGFLGTTTPLQLANGQVVTLSTAALEGTEVAVFLRGSAQLVNGTARIDLPSAFQAIMGPGALTVQLTLTSKDGPVYVKTKAADHIVVESTTSASSTATFDYFVQAPRRGGDAFVV